MLSAVCPIRRAYVPMRIAAIGPLNRTTQNRIPDHRQDRAVVAARPVTPPRLANGRPVAEQEAGEESAVVQVRRPQRQPGHRHPRRRHHGRALSIGRACEIAAEASASEALALLSERRPLEERQQPRGAPTAVAREVGEEEAAVVVEAEARRVRGPCVRLFRASRLVPHYCSRTETGKQRRLRRRRRRRRQLVVTDPTESSRAIRVRRRVIETNTTTATTLATIIAVPQAATQPHKLQRQRLLLSRRPSRTGPPRIGQRHPIYSCKRTAAGHQPR